MLPYTSPLRWPKWIAGRLIWISGIALIVAGVICLYLSDKVVTGWWQGTLQAFGVGFIIAGIVVDVLAITGLNQRIRTEDQRRLEYNRQAEEMLQTPSLDQVIVDLLDHAGGQIDPALRRRLLDSITPQEQPAWSPAPASTGQQPSPCMRSSPPRRFPAAVTGRKPRPKRLERRPLASDIYRTR